MPLVLVCFCLFCFFLRYGPLLSEIKQSILLVQSFFEAKDSSRSRLLFMINVTMKPILITELAFLFGTF